MRRAFTLQTVLQLRQHKEDAAERALAALGAQRQQIEETLARVRRALQRWTEERIDVIGRVSTGHEQHTAYARYNMLRDAQAQLEEQLAFFETRRREQQADYLAARNARTTLTELKQQQSAMQEAAQERKEQRLAEDLFLGRWSR